MMKFKFRLERLFEHRTRLEEIAAAHLAQMLLIFEDAKARLVSLESQQEKLCNDRLHAQEQGDWEQVMATVAVQERLTVTIASARLQVRQAQTAVDDAREAAVKAMADRKLVERLKDKAKQDYDSELLLNELKEIDDLITTRYGREART